jgi:uncharacterized membrane protein
MQMLHTFNISLHVLAGTMALVIGLLALLVRKPSARHFRYGRYFVYLLAVVVGTGFIGLVFFRSSSFLLMLTLGAGYHVYAGYRAVQLRRQRSTRPDALVAGGALAVGLLYLFYLRQADGNWAPPVVYSTLAALALVTGYDLLKYFWLHERIQSWWLYEHIYKMLSAYSAILSAFMGTVLPGFKPYSQLGPSVLCLWLIIFFIWRQAITYRKRPVVMSQ